MSPGCSAAIHHQLVQRPASTDDTVIQPSTRMIVTICEADGVICYNANGRVRYQEQC